MNRTECRAHTLLTLIGLLILPSISNSGCIVFHILIDGMVNLIQTLNTAQTLIDPSKIALRV